MIDNSIFAINVYFTESDSTLLTSKIYGGKKSSHKEYVVYIREKGQIKCGGTLIDYLLVLTAAHCVNEFDLSSPHEFEIVRGSEGESKLDYLSFNNIAIRSLGRCPTIYAHELE